MGSGDMDATYEGKSAIQGEMLMGDKDSISKDFMGDNEIFTEIFNLAIHNGKRIIQADNLREADPNLISYISDELGKQTKSCQRDLLKMLAARQDEHQVYLILGIEEQSDIDYSMPLRVMEYDLLKYMAQLRKIDAKRGAGGSPFTSRLKKGELLIPVITVVIYFGLSPWDGPICLHDILDLGTDPDVRKAVSDYKIHVLDPMSMTREEVEFFQTDFGKVLKVLRCAKDADALNALLNEKPFQHMNHKTVAFIKALSGAKLIFDQHDKGENNMWPAIEELIRRGEEKGRLEGEARGEKIGEKKGEKRGEKRGVKRGKEQGRIEAQNIAITNTIQYHLQKHDTMESIVKMLTCIFQLSSEEAEQRIQQVVKA